jgi:hypothetical protein
MESQYATLSDALTELLPRLEHAVREDQGDERKRVHALRARAYQAAAAAFARQDEADAAWQPIGPSVPLSCLEARSRWSPAISGWPTRSFGSGDSTLPAASTHRDSHPNARPRLLVDVARAYGQRRHTGEATKALLDAECLAPEHVRSHHLAHSTIRDLIGQLGRRAPTDLVELARRSGAMQ